MGSKTSIEWTRGADGSPGATWTPIRARNTKTGKVGWHCEHVTPGCENCYAERLNLRLGTGLPFKPGHLANGDVELYLDDAMLTQPLRWKKPRMIFVCSMSDLFGEFVPDEWIEQVLTIAAMCPDHTFQILTKRAKRMREFLSEDGRRDWIIDRWLRHPLRKNTNRVVIENGPVVKRQPDWPLPNCWFGVSAEDQTRADERIPDLLATPAAVRFCSYEPALGRIDFRQTWMKCPACRGRGYYLPSFSANYFVPCETCLTLARQSGLTILPGQQATPGPRLDWIIAGGESGASARPALKSWFTSARDQCAAAGTAFFHKQNGEWIDADAWATILGHRGDSSPLNYEHAAQLAKMGNFQYEHHSDGSTLIMVGKARAGRLLDGVEHNGMPA